MYIDKLEMFEQMLGAQSQTNADSAVQDTTMEDIQEELVDFCAVDGQAAMDTIMCDMQAWEREQNDRALEEIVEAYFNSTPLAGKSCDLAQFLADMESDLSNDSGYAHILADMETYFFSDSDNGSDSTFSAEGVTVPSECSYEHYLLDEALSEENLVQDLLRCPHVIEPSPEHPDDRLHFLAREYACTFRLLKSGSRWRQMKIPVMWAELKIIFKAMRDPINELSVWPQFETAVKECLEATLNENSLDGTTRRHLRTVTRNRVLNRIKALTTAKLKDIEDELERMLEGKAMTASQMCIHIKRSVQLDILKRGAVVLVNSR